MKYAICLFSLLAACTDDPRPVGRYSHIGLLDTATNRLHIAGGSDLETFFVDAWSFDLDNLTWKTEAPIPQATHRSIAVSSGPSQGLVFGGTTWEDAETNDLFAWNLQDGSWNSTPGPDSPIPAPRYKHAAAWDGARLWIMGGRENDTESPIVFDELWSKNGEEEWVSHPMTNGPGPLFRQGMAWDSENGKLWVYGGIDDENVRSDALFSYDPETQIWENGEVIGSAPLQKASHSLVWTNGGLIAWGGHATDTASWRYDIAANTWTERDTTPAPTARDAQVTALSDDGATLYIVGGDNFAEEATEDFLSDVWSMDTASGEWTQLKETGYGSP
jgi:hypothetical protein